MRPNPSGPRDETIRILRLGSSAVIWSYACHPVFVPQMNHVSADYVGAVRQALRDRFGSDLAVLFWQGFSGNSFPSFASQVVGLGARLRHSWLGVTPAVATQVWKEWTKRLSCQVIDGVRTVPTATVRGELRARRDEIPLRLLLEAENADRHLTTHQLSIGPSIHALGMSAEMSVEYGPVFEAALGHRSLFCVGCIDDVFGYVPTPAMVREGGYEAEEFLPHFSLKGRFRPDLDRVLIQGLLGKARLAA